MVKSYHCKVTGGVQGGNFQVWVMDTAQALGLKGWVRFLSDNQAEILLQGDLSKCTVFRDKLKAEAPVVDLKKLECEFIEYDKKHDSFALRG